MKERQLIEEIHKAYRPAKLFRNDNGTAWAGGKATRRGGLTILDGARRITYGLMPGSADLIGWTPIVITPEMVGQTVAVFTSIEAKTENDRLDDGGKQATWYQNVQAAGGRALIVWEHMGELTEFTPGGMDEGTGTICGSRRRDPRRIVARMENRGSRRD